MKLIIDIDDHEYAEIKEDTEKFRSKGLAIPSLYKAIDSGVPKEIEENAILKAKIKNIKEELHATAEKHSDGEYYLREEWIDEIIDKYKEA